MRADGVCGGARSPCMWMGRAHRACGWCVRWRPLTMCVDRLWGGVRSPCARVACVEARAHCACRWRVLTARANGVWGGARSLCMQMACAHRACEWHVGRRALTVQSYARQSAQKRLAENLRRMTSVQPRSSVSPVPSTPADMWYSGRQQYTTSSRRSGKHM